MIKVLVVEDSRVICDYLVYILETDPELKVIDVAASGEAALAIVEQCRPDVILMDVHLPGIDGIETTRRIMSSNPVPIVICTGSSNFDQVQSAMGIFDAGALALLKKPRGMADRDAEVESAAIINTLKMMSEVKLVRRWKRASPGNKLGMPIDGKPVPRDVFDHDVAVVAIGASTGGPPVVAQILSDLTPGFAAPILVVQHIALGFTAGFASWLASVSKLPVHLAKDGNFPLPGHVYVAPDDHHLIVGARGELQTTRDEPNNGLRPSVGVLFRSVSERFGRRAIGVLLTGMGRDGADELKLLSDRGALTVVQDEESCIVFGMPGEAIKLGAARFVFSPQKIAELLTTVVRRGGTKGKIDAQ